ncbi:HAD domain-containing protein [Silvimonas iriomotensis]|uniref:Uncharacterized protein n=1 Tax=Silvimonas iriomotensis TaxID=449662 RepID=A0ABQ2PAV8_9NEIS|nr:HAD domain-containing protein [Silvimonas iriomotensis]GGP22104.1 hypothetical protein GCM10010970_23570 [Silvimonas iriomotensis]
MTLALHIFDTATQVAVSKIAFWGGLLIQVESTAPALGAKKLMTLYLDFDGVLHPYCVYRTPNGLELRAEGYLFMHAPVLETVLNSTPNQVDIVLSTTWAFHLGLEEAARQLPPTIQSRVIGSTWEPAVEEYDPFSWRMLSRFDQIARHAARHGISPWVALDDDNDRWPEDEYASLILCHRMLGLGVEATQVELARKLAE